MKSQILDDIRIDQQKTKQSKTKLNFLHIESGFHFSINLKSLFLNASLVQSSSFRICSSFNSSRYEPTFPLRRKLLQKEIFYFKLERKNVKFML